MGNKQTTSILQIRRKTDKTLACTGSQTPVTTEDIRNFAIGFNRVAVDDPRWRMKVAAGEDATNPMTVDLTDVTYSQGYVVMMTSRGVNMGQTSTSTLLCNPLTAASTLYSDSLLASAKNEALIGILNRIRQEQQTFSGMTFLGELGQTVAMLKSPAKALREKTGKLYQYLDKYRKGRKRKVGGQDLSKVIADSWLEFSFGIMPLIHDITDIAKALRKQQEGRVKRLTYTAIADSSTDVAGSNGMSSLSGTIYKITSTKQLASARYTVGYAVQAYGNEDAIDRLIALGGFNLSDVVPTAWELIPWSFLIDYFTNIGDVLSGAFTITDGVHWASYGSKQENSVTIYSTGAVTGSTCSKVHQFVPDRFVSKSTHIERKDADLTIPSVRFELPGRNVQFLNMAALLRMRS